MKFKVFLSTVLLFSLTLTSIVLSVEKQEYDTVMVIMEAKPGKESLLKKELINVRNLSRKEPACLEYRVSQDINNPYKFILYEKWRSTEEHKQQFQKSYIIDLGKKLDVWLSTSYQASFSKEQ